MCHGDDGEGNPPVIGPGALPAQAPLSYAGK